MDTKVRFGCIEVVQVECALDSDVKGVNEVE